MVFKKGNTGSAETIDGHQMVNHDNPIVLSAYEYVIYQYNLNYENEV